LASLVTVAEAGVVAHEARQDLGIKGGLDLAGLADGLDVGRDGHGPAGLAAGDGGVGPSAFHLGDLDAAIAIGNGLIQKFPDSPWRAQLLKELEQYKLRLAADGKSLEKRP